MNYTTSIREELERSAPATRRHLERLPEDKLDWRPAERSMNLGQLGLHIAEAPPALASIALRESFDVSGGPQFRQPPGVSEILAAFDEGLTKTYGVLEELGRLSPDAMIAFKAGDTIVFQSPRSVFVRETVLNHTYHHRGQLGVYLRLLGIPVPSTFGPSADERI